MVVFAVPNVCPFVSVQFVLADFVALVVMSVVPMQEEGIVQEKMVVDVPPVVNDVTDWVMLPSSDGVGLWVVLASDMAGVIMVGIWGVIETGSVVGSVLPDMLVVLEMTSVVDMEELMDAMSIDWPDTDNEGKRMPKKRNCRGTVKPVLWKRKTLFCILARQHLIISLPYNNNIIIK